MNYQISLKGLEYHSMKSINKIAQWFRKPYVYAAVFSVLLLGLNLYVLLKTYVISSVEQYVELSPSKHTELSTPGSGKTEITESSYTDGNISISIETVRMYDTDIYVAEIKLSSADLLKTALAGSAFGTNVTQKTSEIAEENGAIFAVNGDYYGANRRGYVIKNGVLYRDSIRGDSGYDDLAIYSDGSWELVNENNVTAQQLVDNGVKQLFAFGPALIKGGSIAVSENDEVGKAMANNPRTVIGIADELHYYVMVSDGRTSESRGLSLYQAAEIMQGYGCRTAYNLDGGGSSTMYFNGSVINNPTTNGRRISERAVSDIVYIGY